MSDTLVWTYAAVGVNFDFSRALQLLKQMPAPTISVGLGGIGLQGPRGIAGLGADTDPGDFTLTFENQLI